MGMGQNWLEFSLSGTQVASLHWYYQNLGTTFDNIAVWQDLSQNKPLFVGELGANTCNLDDSERVTLLAQVVNSLFASGVSLVNIWEGPSGVESVECTYALSWKQLGQLAQAIHW